MAGMKAIEKMSLAELQEAKAQIEAQIVAVQEEEKRKLLAKFADEANALGFDLNELVGKSGKTKGRSGSKAPPKYRHPADPQVTWSGRGKRPAWFIEATEAGVAPESMLITRK